MKKTSTFFRVTLIYFICLVCFVGVRIVFSLGFLSGAESNVQDILSSLIIQVGVMFLIPLALYLLFFKKKPKEAFNNFGFKKITGKAVLICFLIGIIAFILNIVVSSIFNGIINSLGYEGGSSGSSAGDYSIWAFLLNVFTVAVLPAFCEEFLHRGLLMRGMYNSDTVKYALVMSSFCFGLMHLNIVQVFYASILGLLIGFVSIVGKSIWPAVIIHFTNNFINVYLSFAEANGWPLGGFYDTINRFINGNFVLALIVIILVLCILIFALVKLIMELFKITSFEQFKNVMGAVKKSYVNFKKENPDSDVEDYEFVKVVEDEIIDAVPAFQNHSGQKPIDMLLQDTYPKEDLGLMDFIFLYAIICLGTFVTLSTFMWGILW